MSNDVEYVFPVQPVSEILDLDYFVAPEPVVAGKQQHIQVQPVAYLRLRFYLVFFPVRQPFLERFDDRPLDVVVFADVSCPLSGLYRAGRLVRFFRSRGFLPGDFVHLAGDLLFRFLRRKRPYLQVELFDFQIELGVGLPLPPAPFVQSRSDRQEPGREHGERQVRNVVLHAEQQLLFRAYDLPYFRLEAGHVGLRDAEPEILFQVKVRNQYGEPDQNDSDRDEEFV